MFARGSRFTGSPETIEASLQHVKEAILPAAERLDGFAGMLALVDWSSGGSLGITLWESEAHMRTSEEAADRLRADSAAGSGEEIVGVDRYEVAIDTRRGGTDG